LEHFFAENSEFVALNIGLELVPAMIIGKLVSGISAVILAFILTKNNK